MTEQTRTLTVAEAVKLFEQEGVQPHRGLYHNYIDGRANACLVGALALHEGAAFKAAPYALLYQLHQRGFTRPYLCGIEVGFDREHESFATIRHRRGWSREMRLGFVLGRRVALRFFGPV